jgi:light-regulated signal transduction histidine kinase (bacteriophytochrome)
MHQVTFVEHGVTIDLTNCDREPIHVPGQIQAHGVLLAVDQATRCVVQVSDNVEHYLGLPPQSVLGRTVSEVLGALVGSALQQVLTPEHPENVPTHVFQGMVAGRGPFDVIAHRSGSLVVIEAERPSDAPAPPDFYATVSAAFARLQGAASLREYFDVLALTIRQLTGYDRVMIYRFADDWSGEVVAELLKELKAHDHLRSIPVVVLTTSTNPDDVDLCYRHHANAYQVKANGFSAIKQQVKVVVDYWFEHVVLTRVSDESLA